MLQNILGCRFLSAIISFIVTFLVVGEQAGYTETAPNITFGLVLGACISVFIEFARWGVLDNLMAGKFQVTNLLLGLLGAGIGSALAVLIN